MMPHSLDLWAVVASDGMYVATRLSHEDAQMTAAAPDLLAACQAAVTAIQHNADSGKSDCDCDGDCEIAFALWTEAESLLNAAIARATGGAS
jgi:hypothetical protein